MRKLNPIPNGNDRENLVKQVRNEATSISCDNMTDQLNNQETYKLNPPVVTFTKSLPHDDFGIVDPNAFETMIAEINQDGTNPKQTPFLGTYSSKKPAKFDITLFSASYQPMVTNDPAFQLNGPRAWESPLAGHVFELEGPDSNSVSIPPAPVLGSEELTAEMAELYAMALCRDIPFTNLQNLAEPVAIDGATTVTMQDLLDALNNLAWNNEGSVSGANLTPQLSERQTERRKARFTAGNNRLSLDGLYRGSTEGAKKGPYISQFLLIGSPIKGARGNPQPAPTKIATPLMMTGAAFVAPNYVTEGIIRWGCQSINQKLLPHRENLDYMTDLSSWINVQNGADLKDDDEYENMARFVTRPRDLATYVHFDQLYQAYQNAMLILIGLGAQTDKGLPEGGDNYSSTRSAFATFGNPHILTLMPEVATRALKAVRRQKYQIHLRARPEALGGVLALAKNRANNSKLGNALLPAQKMLTELEATELMKWTNGRNQYMNTMKGVVANPGDWIANGENYLLSQAFPEGSPVHGSYGAGHATVAGACTTILKAFFEMYDVPGFVRGDIKLDNLIANGHNYFPGSPSVNRIKLTDYPEIADSYVPDATGQNLVGIGNPSLTIEEELDKLAANISIGRNFGGVHYYTDYYESLRMGERVAVGLLQEQMLTYREPVSMRFTSFDGDMIMITGTGGAKNKNDALVHIWERGTGTKINQDVWWNRAF